MILLTKQEALKTVILFIKIYCDETGSNDAKNILNSLINIDQNNPPKNELIHWDNYLDRARKMISKKASRKSFTTNMVELFSEQEIFEAMILLLEDFYHKTNSDDLGAFLGDLLHPDYGETADDAAWEEWQECLHRVKNSKK